MGSWYGKRTPNDDTIVSICWKLGGLIVDCPIGLGDGNAEKKQRPRVQIHGGSAWHKRQAIPTPFCTS